VASWGAGRRGRAAIFARGFLAAFRFRQPAILGLALESALRLCEQTGGGRRRRTVHLQRLQEIAGTRGIAPLQQSARLRDRFLLLAHAGAPGPRQELGRDRIRRIELQGGLESARSGREALRRVGVETLAQMLGGLLAVAVGGVQRLPDRLPARGDDTVGWKELGGLFEGDRGGA